MQNITHIIKQVTNFIEENKKSYKDYQKFSITIRFGKHTARVGCRFDELLKELWQILDGEHKVFEGYNKSQMSSIFITDYYTGKIVFDSKYYRQNKTKRQLQHDGDVKIKFFKHMKQNEKNRIVELTCEQINNTPIEELMNKSDDPWGKLDGDMPWLE